MADFGGRTVLVTGASGGFGGEVAAPIVFLLGDDASMIEGVSLPVDGGCSSR